MYPLYRTVATDRNGCVCAIRYLCFYYPGYLEKEKGKTRFFLGKAEDMNYKKPYNLKKIIFFASFFLALTSVNAPAAVEEYTPEYLNGKSYWDYINKVINSGYSPDVFVKIDRRNMERIENQKVIDTMLKYATAAAPISSTGVEIAEYLRQEASANIKQTVIQNRQQREQNAAANGEFNYVTYTDGGTDYFTDGLLTTSVNRVKLDELGNTSLSSTYNMIYNDDRLLVSYEGDSVDNLGNKSTFSWTGTYLPGSLFYATAETNAYKSYSSYNMTETDSVGNTTETEWTAISYDPTNKYQLSYSQKTTDSVYGTSEFTRSSIEYASGHIDRPSYYYEEGVGTDGLSYTAERKDIEYNDRGQVTYFDDTTKVDYSSVSAEPDAEEGNIVTTHTIAKFTYLEETPNLFGKDIDPMALRLASSEVTTSVTKADGSFQDDYTTTDYVYDETFKLVDASSDTTYSGQAAQWYQYTDSEGNVLTEGSDGTYFYVNEDDEEVEVDAADVVTTVKDGDTYSGTSTTAMEILYGKPMAKTTTTTTSYTNAEDGYNYKTDTATVTYENDLVHNLQRVLSSTEETETNYPYLDPDKEYLENTSIVTTYTYDQNTANLADVSGSGTKTGYLYSSTTSWHDPYTNNITKEYDIILGKPVMTTYTEEEEEVE